MIEINRLSFGVCATARRSTSTMEHGITREGIL
jgi:hypothetical protein